MQNPPSNSRLLQPSIPIGFLNDVLQAARYRGMDTEQLLLDKGITNQRLQSSSHRISVELYSQVLKQLRDETDDAFMGFLSRKIPKHAFRVFSFSVVGCRNLEEFIKQANEFYALFCDDFRWRMEYEDRSILLVIELDRHLPVDYRFIVHSLHLMTIRLFGWLLGEDVDCQAVYFDFSKNETDDNLQYLFDCPIHYNTRSNAIRIDQSYGKARLSCTRDQVAQMLKNTQHLFLISRNKAPLSQETRRLLLLHKLETWLNVDQVAAHFGYDKHQLWRKLEREGRSFLEIRDGVKRDWALALLENPELTIDAVAETLRYAEVSAFRKAFRKWTGVAPGQYRKQLHA